MADFAVLNGDTVINTLIAETKTIAEELTGKTCVEFTPGDGAEPGGTYDSKKKTFTRKQPYPSWSLNSDNEWVAPVPIPNPTKWYDWDEETTSWIEVTE